MDTGGMLAAQFGVALRAAIIAFFGYGVWVVVSGSAFDPVTWTAVSGVLWGLGNAAFLLAKWYAPGMLSVAEEVEREL